MRLFVLLFISSLLPAAAHGEAAGPVFGGSASGPFEIAEITPGKFVKIKVPAHVASGCPSLDCTGSIKPANLPVSGRKP